MSASQPVKWPAEGDRWTAVVMTTTDVGFLDELVAASVVPAW